MPDKGPHYASPEAECRAALEEWRRFYTTGCGCEPFELRAEIGGDECANCCRKVRLRNAIR